jgi:hypothetical protein
MNLEEEKKVLGKLMRSMFNKGIGGLSILSVYIHCMFYSDSTMLVKYIYTGIILFFLFSVILDTILDENLKNTNRKKECFTVFLSGIIFMSCVLALTRKSKYIQLYLYLISLIFYHLMEYYAVYKYHFEKLSWDSMQFFLS